MNSALRSFVAALDPERGIHLDGRGRAASRMVEVLDHATGEVIAEVADGTVTEAVRAVDAAAAAFPAWAEALHRAYELMVADLDRLAELIACENGKSITDAGADAVAFARGCNEDGSSRGTFANPRG